MEWRLGFTVKMATGQLSLLGNYEMVLGLGWNAKLGAASSRKCSLKFI